MDLVLSQALTEWMSISEYSFDVRCIIITEIICHACEKININSLETLDIDKGKEYNKGNAKIRGEKMGIPTNIKTLLSGRVVEWARIEFKETWDAEASLKTICAFANDIDNWGGGYLVIGVRDDQGKPDSLPGVPQEKIDGYLKDLLNKCKRIQPEYMPITEVVEYQGKYFIIVWAPGGSIRPYSSPKNMAKDTRERICWIRKMASTIMPSDEELRDLYSLANNVPFDDRVNHFAELNDLNITLIQQYLREVGSSLYPESGQMDFAEATDGKSGREAFYPDANLTLRVAYGHIKGYNPSDGVYYKPSSTLTGIIEKDNPEIFDYDIPQNLRDIYAEKDYGRWADENGEVPVCFIATNHTTGGNSGSPIIDKDGHLIGINFDRVWEGTMSDIVFDPEICRNISLDIRYLLFVIDKVADADHIIEEMTLVE